MHDPCQDTDIVGYIKFSDAVNNILRDQGIYDSHNLYIKGSLNIIESEELGDYLYLLMMVDDLKT
jgi:hypothetical protein